jgi:hypothetical protein
MWYYVLPCTKVLRLFYRFSVFRAEFWRFHFPSRENADLCLISDFSTVLESTS